MSTSVTSPGGGRAKLALQKVGLYRPARTLWLSVKRPEWWRREQKRRGFYRNLFPDRSLCFDVGANVGEYTTDLRALGARVIAIEPQPACIDTLRAAFAEDADVTVVPAAVGPAAGSVTMYTTDATAIGSCSKEWVDAMKASGRFGTRDWAKPIEVPMTTLDALIARHGLPSFCKIDVEGFELDVLCGLTQPVSMLSFEFTPETLHRTRDCVDYLAGLGPYEFNFSAHDHFAHDAETWAQRDEFHERLGRLPEPALKWGGDVYARCGR